MRGSNVLLLLASLAAGLGCGDNSGNSGNGVDGGARADANDTDAAPTSATCGIVIATAGGACAGLCGDSGSGNLAGIPVLFSKPDGSLLGTALTNVKGEAFFDACVPDTTISFLLLDEDDPLYSTIFSYAGVQPGDTAYYGAPFAPTEGLYASINLVFDQDIGDHSLSEIYLQAGCLSTDYGASSVPASVSFVTSKQCQGNHLGTEALALLKGPGGGNGSIIAYSFVKDHPFTTGTPDMSVENQVPMPPFTFGSLDNSFVVSGLPDSYEGAYTSRHSYVDGRSFRDSSESSDEGPVFAWSDYDVPDEFGEATSAHVDVELPTVGLTERYRTLSVYRPFDRDLSLDFSQALPAFEGILPIGSGTATPSLIWVAPTEDVTFTTISAYFADPDGRADPDDSLNWFIVVPGNPGSFSLPQLPADYSDFLALRDLLLVPALGAVHSVSWFDYQTLIETPGFRPDDVVEGDRLAEELVPPPAADADVTYRASAWYQNED